MFIIYRLSDGHRVRNAALKNAPCFTTGRYGQGLDAPFDNE